MTGDTLHKKLDELNKKVDDVQMLIVGNPPKQKGIFQRMDEANGKIKWLTKAVIGIVLFIIGLVTPRVSQLLLKWL